MKYADFSQEVVDKIYNSITGCHGDSTANPSGLYNDIAENIGRYEHTLDAELRKKSGSFYTDKNIIDFILKNILEDIDIVQNPYIRVLDPSCGCGYFLSTAYDILKAKLTDNVDSINRMHPELNLSMKNIHEHIIRYNIFGIDLDEVGVKLAIITLMLKKAGSAAIPNIMCCDSLMNMKNMYLENMGPWNKKFDIIVGNPPYIGHKKISGQYRKLLNSIYGDIFKDKADISFCFIKSSIDRLVEGGRLCFITSRYFIESPSGKSLRNYIRQNCTIQGIVDFYGVRIMRGISVDPVIVYIKKSLPHVEVCIDVVKAKQSLKDVDVNNIFEKISSRDSNFVKSFYVSQSVLDDEGWILCNNDEMSIFKKVEEKLSIKLSDACTSFQGIITGCDKAFVMDKELIEEYGIERDIIRKWIKNSSIEKFKVEETGLYLIYSNFIESPGLYPGAVNYIGAYRERLEKRRECINGVREWYQLQWGRESRLFDARKIVFPYKSSSNRFAIDQGSYNSADVYGMIINDKYEKSISYEFLAGLLNSKLYEFYFKSFAKKLGDNMYDYYPNKVMQLMVPEKEDHLIAMHVREVMDCKDQSLAGRLINEIDRCVYKMFKLSDNDIDIVERGLKSP